MKLKLGSQSILLLAVVLLFWFSLYTYTPIVSVYSKELRASAEMIGVIAGVYGLTQMALRVPLGIISDRTGRRKPYMLMGIGFSVAAAAAVCLIQTPLSLLVSRAMGGFAAAAWVPFTMLFAGRFDDARVPAALGLVTAVCNLGQLAGTFTGGFIAGGYGRIYTYWAAAGAGVLALLLGLFISDKSCAKSEPPRVRDLFAVGSQKSVLLPSILCIVVQYIGFATNQTFTPLVAKELYGASEEMLGILTALYTLALVAGSMLVSRIEPRFGARPFMVFSFVLTGALCMLTPFAGSLYLLSVVQLICGFLRGAGFSLLMSLAVRDQPKESRASAMGFFQAIYALGIMLGPIVTGLFADGGYTLAFGSLLVISLLAAVASLFFIQKASSKS